MFIRSVPSIIVLGDKTIDIAIMIHLTNQTTRIVVISGRNGLAQWMFTLKHALPVPPVGVSHKSHIPRGLLLWLPKVKITQHLSKRDVGVVTDFRTRRFGRRFKRDTTKYLDEPLFRNLINNLRRKRKQAKEEVNEDITKMNKDDTDKNVDDFVNSILKLQKNDVQTNSYTKDENDGKVGHKSDSTGRHSTHGSTVGFSKDFEDKSTNIHEENSDLIDEQKKNSIHLYHHQDDDDEEHDYHDEVFDDDDDDDDDEWTDVTTTADVMAEHHPIKEHKADVFTKHHPITEHNIGLNTNHGPITERTVYPSSGNSPIINHKGDVITHNQPVTEHHISEHFPITESKANVKSEDRQITKNDFITEKHSFKELNADIISRQLTSEHQPITELDADQMSHHHPITEQQDTTDNLSELRDFLVNLEDRLKRETIGEIKPTQTATITTKHTSPAVQTASSTRPTIASTTEATLPETQTMPNKEHTIALKTQEIHQSSKDKPTKSENFTKQTTTQEDKPLNCDLPDDKTNKDISAVIVYRDAKNQLQLMEIAREKVIYMGKCREIPGGRDVLNPGSDRDVPLDLLKPDPI